VYVTRRLRKDGSTYYGPYFPGNLAHRMVHFIHRHFLVPSCKVDLTRYHPKPCLQYHIHRCLGPCVEGLTTDDAYAHAAQDVRLFLEGRHSDLAAGLRKRMQLASDEMRFEEATGLRDLLASEDPQDKATVSTVEAFTATARSQPGDALRHARGTLAYAGALGISHENLRWAWPLAARAASELGDDDAARELLALVDSCRPGHLAPMQRAERDLVRARLAAANGDPTAAVLRRRRDQPARGQHALPPGPRPARPRRAPESHGRR